MIHDATTRAQHLQRIRGRFELLYGAERADRCMNRLGLMLSRYADVLAPISAAQRPRWTQADNVLITYGDSILNRDEKPLLTLKRFLAERLEGVIDTVHLLPFYPWSSDDGFSVIHYRKVKPELGGWPDVMAIGERFRLMFDLVLNHCSRRSDWFRDYITGVAPARYYFIEVEPGTDLGAVTRPRPSPLLHPVQTRTGERWVWTTFSADQVDLNFANPDLLLEMVDILLFYVSGGARIIRLDAIAYLWKQIGTHCIHLPQTHEVVKLIHDVLELLAPHVILLTETNVPHTENISYFGAGDEAHMVYNFSLPPLLLHAMQSGSGRYLTRWAKTLGSPPPGCTYLNFTASHDGIGVRPLEGIVPRAEIARLCARISALGGFISERTNAEGGASPYELNITWFDAMGMPDVNDDALKVQRLLCSQTIALAMRGVPAVYIQSLLAAPNDQEGVKTLGYPRAINRKKWQEREVNALLQEPTSSTAQVFSEYTRRLGIRARQPAFHPEAAQRVLDYGDHIFALERIADGGEQRIVCISNLTAQTIQIQRDVPRHDLLQELPPGRKRIELGPYQTRWLAG